MSGGEEKEGGGGDRWRWRAKGGWGRVEGKADGEGRKGGWWRRREGGGGALL